MPTKKEVDDWTQRMNEFRERLKRIDVEDKAELAAIQYEFESITEYSRRLFGADDA